MKSLVKDVKSQHPFFMLFFWKLNFAKPLILLSTISTYSVAFHTRGLGLCSAAWGQMMQCGIMISPLIHYRLSLFVFWHGRLWPRAPVCLHGCFYPWLSSPATGTHPHKNIPTKSKQTQSHVHTHTHTHTHTNKCTDTMLLAWMRWRWKSVKGGPAVHQVEVHFQVICVGWYVL